MKYLENCISSEYVYKGIIVNVRVDDAELVNGQVVKREVSEHPGGVAVLPVTDSNECFLVRQFRYPYQKEMFEVPAGKLEYGENHLSCAVRELSEETGFSADKMVYLGSYATSPGYSTEMVHIYLALGLHEGTAHPDSNEFLDIERYSLNELIRMVSYGEIEDAKTVLAVLLTCNYLHIER